MAMASVSELRRATTVVWMDRKKVLRLPGLDSLVILSESNNIPVDMTYHSDCIRCYGCSRSPALQMLSSKAVLG